MEDFNYDLNFLRISLNFFDSLDQSSTNGTKKDLDKLEQRRFSLTAAGHQYWMDSPFLEVKPYPTIVFFFLLE